MDPHEPYWQTNMSFSPPLSRRWEHGFQTEGLQYGSSRMSVRDHSPNHSASDGAGSYFSSPFDSFQIQQWTPPPTEGVIDDCMSRTMREPTTGPLAFTPTMEGTSVLPYGAGSTSSHSDGSEYEAMVKSYVSSNRSFSSRYSFMSKPVHPISFLNQTPDKDAYRIVATGNSLNQPTPNDNSSTKHFDLQSVRSIVELQSITGFSEVGATMQRETLRWSSSSSSLDFTDVSEQLDSECTPSYNLSEGFKCGLCERFLLQRSPWCSRRIVRSGDMPVTGVLSCCHVFHADCLEQTTPKVQKHDPSCPLCARSENALEQQVVSRLRSGFPRFRPYGEDGPSRPRGCGQVGDCVEGVLHASPRNRMLLLNRSRLKKHLSLLPDKLKRSGSFSSQMFDGRSVEQEAVECSSLTAGPG